MIRVAMLSFWHVHAKDYLRQIAEHPNTELAAVWDEVAERGRTQAEALGVPYYEQLSELLAAPQIDAVVVCAPTNRHREVMTAAAKAGKHLFTEKVIAATTKECLDVLAAADKAGVKLTVSLPRLNLPFAQEIRRIVRDGMLGDLTLVRARLSHSGALPTEDGRDGWLPHHFFQLEPACGGAMTDLGCHPMYLVRLLLGMPDSVAANYGYVTGREVEDNAVTVLRYASGALGIVEAGFVNRHSPFVLEVHGTEGTVLYSKHNDQLIMRGSKLPGAGRDGWHIVTELPPSLPTAYEQWVSHILNDTFATENIRLALDLTRLVEASNLSARSGTACKLCGI